LRDLKQEMEHSNGLSTGYARNEAKFIADQALHFRSTYLQSVMTPKVKELDITIHKIANKARFEFYVGIYNALRLQCETEYDIFMNRDLWVVVAEPFCDRTHSQYGIVAIVRALMVVVNKEIWKAFLDNRLSILKKDAGKRKKREISAETELKKKQMTAREQCIEMIGEEFTKKMGSTPTRS